MEDRISKLPVEVIHDIMCRLTIDDVVRTNCLSKTWKNFCVSFPCLVIDSRSLSYEVFKDLIKKHVRSMIMHQKHLVIHKFRLHLNYNFVQSTQEDIESCIRLVSETRTITQIDFQITNHYPLMTGTFFHHIYSAETLTMLRLSGLTLAQPLGDMKLCNLQILRLEAVELDRENDISWLFSSCPMIMELRLVNCHNLEHLNVFGLNHLKQLEIGFCTWLGGVEIQAPSLQKLVLSEIRRRREDEFFMALRIDSETCEALRELTLCNSSILGNTFSSVFSKCSNVESLVLDRCMHFYKIKIASQRLRKLVVRRCFDLVITDIKAPNLTAFNFCNYLPLHALEDLGAPLKYKYKEEISHQQECMLDLNQMLSTKNMWISLWFDKFKDTEGQKMVIYPKNKRYDVVVLEDWRAIAELSLMIKITEEARRTTITTMSFLDLADYMFGDKGKSDMLKVLAISSTDESKLHEVLKEKPYISSSNQCSSTVTDKIEVEAFLSSTYTLLSFCNVNGFSYNSLPETETETEIKTTATLKAIQLRVTPC